MNFDVCGQIIQIEQSVKMHCKCIIKDSFSSVVVLIPSNLLKDISINDEVQILGQIKGYEYNEKIYNNLFAKSIIKCDQKYVLLKKENIADSANPHFKILKYSPGPFDTEEMNKIIIEENKNTVRTSLGNKGLLKLFLTKNQESSLYYNAYSSNLQKAMLAEHIYKEEEVIKINQGSSYFSKIINKARFVFFGKEETRSLYSITVPFKL